MHPATKSLLGFFAWQHLPEALQKISKPFSELAEIIAHGPVSRETTAALRRLLESKDCAVRAYVEAT